MTIRTITIRLVCLILASVAVTLPVGCLVAWLADRSFNTQFATSEFGLDEVSAASPQQALSVGSDVLSRAVDVSIGKDSAWHRTGNAEPPIHELDLLPPSDLRCRSIDIGVGSGADETGLAVLMLKPGYPPKSLRECLNDPWRLVVGAGKGNPTIHELQTGVPVLVSFADPKRRIVVLSPLKGTGLRALRLRRASCSGAGDPVWIDSARIDVVGRIELARLSAEPEQGGATMVLAPNARVDLAWRFLLRDQGLFWRWFVSRLAWFQGGFAAVVGIAIGLFAKSDGKPQSGSPSGLRPLVNVRGRSARWRSSLY